MRQQKREIIDNFKPGKGKLKNDNRNNFMPRLAVEYGIQVIIYSGKGRSIECIGDDGGA